MITENNKTISDIVTAVRGEDFKDRMGDSAEKRKVVKLNAAGEITDDSFVAIITRLIDDHDQEGTPINADTFNNWKDTIVECYDTVMGLCNQPEIITDEQSGARVNIIDEAGVKRFQFANIKGDRGIQGVQGNPGNQGPPGELGPASFSVIASSQATMPPKGSSVTVYVINAVGFAVQQCVHIEEIGYFRVNAVDDVNNTLDLINLGVENNANAAASIPYGKKIVVSGFAGPEGKVGDTGSMGPQGLVGNQGETGLGGYTFVTNQINVSPDTDQFSVGVNNAECFTAGQIVYIDNIDYFSVISSSTSLGISTLMLKRLNYLNNASSQITLEANKKIVTAGLRGLQGIQGYQGTAGTNGAQGDQGTPGTNGTNGTNGTTGAIGATGAKGETGQIHVRYSIDKTSMTALFTDNPIYIGFYSGESASTNPLDYNWSRILGVDSMDAQEYINKRNQNQLNNEQLYFIEADTDEDAYCTAEEVRYNNPTIMEATNVKEALDKMATKESIAVVLGLTVEQLNQLIELSKIVEVSSNSVSFNTSFINVK